MPSNDDTTTETRDESDDGVATDGGDRAPNGGDRAPGGEPTTHRVAAPDGGASDDALLSTAREAGPLDSSEESEAAIVATMETLGERITDGQAEELAESLPETAAEALRGSSPGEAEGFPLPVFLSRVADRTESDAEAVEIVRAAMSAIREVADPDAFERTREQLPPDYDVVLEPGEYVDAETFHETVAEGLPEGVDPDRATNAVLETVAERVTGGQAGDLATYLPRGVREPLTGAVEEGAESFDPDEFRRRVADRSGVDDDGATATDRSVATEVTRAVFGAMAETAAESQLADARSQLPDEYQPLFEAEG